MTPRAHMNARLPHHYFADAQDHSPARQTAASGHHSPHGITGASPELAKPAPADDAATGGRGLLSEGGTTMVARSTAPAINGDAGTGNGPTQHHSTAGGAAAPGASFARHAAGVGRQAYTVAAKRIERGQQLRAARILGPLSTKPHGSR